MRIRAKMLNIQIGLTELVGANYSDKPWHQLSPRECGV